MLTGRTASGTLADLAASRARRLGITIEELRQRMAAQYEAEYGEPVIELDLAPVDPIEETDAMADTVEWYLGDVLRV